MVGVKILIILACTVAVMPTWGENRYVSIPMHFKSAKTFYVTGKIEGTPSYDFMVDTGSSYTTINEHTLGELRAQGDTLYLRDLVAVLANGDEMMVPIYRISALEVGGACILDDIEVAVFPNRTRQILGLSALKKASPFQFSVDPPELRLSNCQMATPKSAAVSPAS